MKSLSQFGVLLICCCTLISVSESFLVKWPLGKIKQKEIMKRILQISIYQQKNKCSNIQIISFAEESRKIKKNNLLDDPSPTKLDKLEVDELKNMLVRRMLTAKRRYEILDRLSS